MRGRGYRFDNAPRAPIRGPWKKISLCQAARIVRVSVFVDFMKMCDVEVLSGTAENNL